MVVKAEVSEHIYLDKSYRVKYDYYKLNCDKLRTRNFALILTDSGQHRRQDGGWSDINKEWKACPNTKRMPLKLPV